ncbi:MAG: hypothetical protein NT080_11975 [Spirochaetes bacterium]|nr:hypothetical protein [Spirochaetota bacterium]
MNPGDIAFLVSRLVVMAAAAFLAILVWSRTRDIAWMLVVIGTVAGYTDVLFSTLTRFGIVPESAGMVAGIPLAAIAFANLPYIFYSTAFLIMIARKRLR